MHGRQWTWGVQACRREPEQGLRDGTGAGSAAANASTLRESGGLPGGRPLALAGRGVGQLAGGVGGRGAARETESTGRRGRKRREPARHGGRDRGQMALNPGPQTLKSLGRDGLWRCHSPVRRQSSWGSA